jgi:hypothetical protein
MEGIDSSVSIDILFLERSQHHPGSWGGAMRVLDLSRQQKILSPDPVREKFQ